MPDPKTGDVDSAVRVEVTPSQSSYFAGEPFSVTITFTNTRLPDAPPPRSFSHTRASHSISSAPLSRPPTSPGTPRTPATAIPTRVPKGNDVATRKGLIGKHLPSNEAGSNVPLDPKKKKMQARSLSVSITSPHENISLGDDGPSSSSPLRTSSIPLNHAPKSPVARSQSLPITPNHPHARKVSVLDGNLQLHDMSNSMPPSPYALSTLSASSSAFSLILDPIAENTPSFQPSPSLTSPPTQHLFDAMHARPKRPKGDRRPPQIGLGQPPGVSKSNVLRTAFSSSFPQANTELILYSYAQLSGTVTIAFPSGITPTPPQLRALHTLRSRLARRPAIGGGSMDINSSLRQSHRRQSHSRSASLSSGLLSLLSPSSIVASASTPATPSSSRFTGLLSPSPSSTASDKVGLGIFVQEEIDPEAPLPTFEVQPTMLAVDLCLLPGESRSFTYTLPLPDILPPTFRGRTMKFSYELVVGTCRASSSAKSAGKPSVSRVMKVPIRVYNHVTVGKPLQPYDLLSPDSRRPVVGTDSGAKVVEAVKLPQATDQNSRSRRRACVSLSELQQYALKLSAALPGPPTQVELPLGSRGDLGWERDNEEGALTGCREAVELLTRNSRKVSYDVNKDGIKVAVLTFTKSAYRLGETALGVVELNERTSRARVLSLSAMLESQESLPSSICSPTNSRQMRRVHAEHHSSFVLSNLRTTFSLDIPSDACPAFQVKVGGNIESEVAQPGGLEWKVRLCLLVAVASKSSLVSDEGVRFKNIVRDGPRGPWGSSWKATSGLSPMELLDTQLRRPPRKTETPKRGSSWTSYLAASLLGVLDEEDQDADVQSGEEDGEYDGVRGDKEGGVGVGVNFGGGEEGWRDVRLETVECEVPIKVWPGNTAFKAVEVVFNV